MLRERKYNMHMMTPLTCYFFNTKRIFSPFYYLELVKELAGERSKLERTRTLNLFCPVNEYVLQVTCKSKLVYTSHCITLRKQSFKLILFAYHACFKFHTSTQKKLVHKWRQINIKETNKKISFPKLRERNFLPGRSETPLQWQLFLSVLFSSFVNDRKQITIYLRFMGFDLIKVQSGLQLCVQSVKCLSKRRGKGTCEMLRLIKTKQEFSELNLKDPFKIRIQESLLKTSKYTTVPNIDFIKQNYSIPSRQ